VKGIVFDSDGVLVDSMAYHRKAWKAAFKIVACLVLINTLIHFIGMI
jgi:beta-phosphoglucomutase-like phosphatase (HAD superfamily)